MARTKEEIVRALKCIANNTNTRYWVGNALHNMIELEGLQELASESLKLIESKPGVVRCKDCGLGEERKDNTGDCVVICHNPDNGTFEYTHKPEWYCGDGISKGG